MSEKHYFVPGQILLPDPQQPLETWSCIACDQFTSDPEYWHRAEAVVGQAPSTLKLVLPEVYLEQPGVEQRIEAIHSEMADCRSRVLTRQVNGFVYVERTQLDGSIRAGLVGCIDLEDYSYEKGAKPAIRPSESTVVSRIPPRLAVRRGAQLELPHVMMLVDDRENTLVEPIGAVKAGLPLLYSGELMLEGGAISGWAVEDPALTAQIVAAADALGSQGVFDAFWPQAAGQPPIAMAVGDGNHSLATAKAYWETIKATLTPEQRENHPARHCLVEVVNIHSEAIAIEPIHRVLYNTDKAAVLAGLERYSRENGLGFAPGSGEQAITLIAGSEESRWQFATPKAPLTVGTVEQFVEWFLAENPAARVDYVHDAPAIRALAKTGAVALELPGFEKSDLFKGVVLGGVLPRKTFSMGHAVEKRYYLECRAIAKENPTL